MIILHIVERISWYTLAFSDYNVYLFIKINVKKIATLTRNTTTGRHSVKFEAFKAIWWVKVDKKYKEEKSKGSNQKAHSCTNP